MTFEYKILLVPGITDRFVKQLNALGGQGWELVALTPSVLDISGWSDHAWGNGSGEISGGYKELAAVLKRGLSSSKQP